MKLRKQKDSKAERREPSKTQSLPRNQYFRASDSEMRRRQYSRVASSQDHSTRDTPSKKKASNKRLAVQWSTLFSAAILAGLLVVIFYASSIATRGSEVIVSQDSFSFRDPNEYESFVDKYISGNLLSRSKLFFPVSDFNQAFVNEYPETTSIKTNVPVAGRNIQVIIETPEPLFRIEGSADSELSAKYIDASGSVVGSTGSEDSSIPTMRLDSSGLTEVGSQLLTQNEVEIISLFEQEITPSQINGLPDSFSVKSADLDIVNGRLEIAVIGAPYIVRFSTYSDARNQVGALKAMMTELYSSERSGGDELPREYIDVRVYEKVFIK